MRPGARPPPPPLDAVLCLIAFLCAEAAVSEGGVYHGESDCFTQR